MRHTRFTFIDASRTRTEDITDAFLFAAKIHAWGQLHLQNASGAVWLRGQSSKEWSLQPSIGRSGNTWLGLSLRPTHQGKAKKLDDLSVMCGIEYNLLHQFRRYAHTQLQREPTRWETITMAQHHGLPTRLLDWTSNPLVALYFAAEADNDSDGVVYAFRPRDIPGLSWVRRGEDRF
jgi:hypothetical protein